MPHGWPDGKVADPQYAIGRLDEMAELAVRLGSPVLYERHGKVLFIDTFETGLNRWDPRTAGANSAIKQGILTARSGGFSAYLKAGPLTTSYARIHTYFSYREASKVGVEFSFSADTLNTIIVFYGRFWRRTYSYSGGIKLNLETNAIYFRNDTPAWELLEDIWWTTSLYPGFRTVKAVFDFAQGKYVRLMISEDTWDISAHSIYRGVGTVVPRLEMYVEVLPSVDGDVITYLDDVIVTQHEP